MAKKKIIVIVGPSGSGKTNLIQRTFQPEQVLRSITTRPMRPGEVDGENYLFITNDAYEAHKADNDMIQTVTYDRNQYGVTKSEVFSKLKQFDTVAVAVVIESVQDYVDFGQLNDIDVISVFTYISKDMLLKHFEHRTESQKEKEHRISKYDNEIKNAKLFDKNHILNMDADDFGASASQQLIKLIESIDKL